MEKLLNVYSPDIETILKIMRCDEFGFLVDREATDQATVITRRGKMNCFKIGKGVSKGSILLPCSFNLYTEYIMQTAGLDEAQAVIGFPGEISVTSSMQMTPSLGQKAKMN